MIDINILNSVLITHKRNKPAHLSFHSLKLIVYELAPYCFSIYQRKHYPYESYIINNKSGFANVYMQSIMVEINLISNQF